MADPLIANIRRVCLANFPSGYQLGTHLTIENPVGFTHRGQQWADRVAARRGALRHQLQPRARPLVSGRLLGYHPEPPASLEELRTGPVLGVDLNAEHLACCVLDARPSCSSIMAVSSRLLEGVKFCRRESRGHSCADPVPKHGPGPQIIGRTSDEVDVLNTRLAAVVVRSHGAANVVLTKDFHHDHPNR